LPNIIIVAYILVRAVDRRQLWSTRLQRFAGSG